MFTFRILKLSATARSTSTDNCVHPQFAIVASSSPKTFPIIFTAIRRDKSLLIVRCIPGGWWVLGSVQERKWMKTLPVTVNTQTHDQGC